MAGAEARRGFVVKRHGPWLAGIALGAAALGYARLSTRSGSEVPTAEVTRGEFVERLELRGEIRPLRSVTLASPMQSGQLQITALAPAGRAVREGDVVVQFDDTTIARTIQDTASALKQADAELDQARARARITDEQDRTALVKAEGEVTRARLDAGIEDLVARLDLERARLALADAEQRLRETERKVEADRAAADAEIARLERQRDKVQDDLARATAARATLELRAPAAGTVHLLPNRMTGSPMSPPQDFREGDRAFPGAPIAELPDLSAVLFSAQVEEVDRGRLRPGQAASVRVDAIPDRAFDAAVSGISVLARVDFRAGFPPPRNFELELRLAGTDPRIRPGMSATARIAVDRLEDVLRLPAEALFLVDGRPVAYRRAGRGFEEVEVDVLRRSAADVAVRGGVEAGDLVAVTQPPGPLRGQR